jgi:hypothetical protein
MEIDNENGRRLEGMGRGQRGWKGIRGMERD